MSYNNLENYYKTVFSMLYNFRWPDFEDLIPYERDLYIAMIKAEQIKQQEDQIRQQMREHKAQGLFDGKR
jgi:hypothetical protein